MHNYFLNNPFNSTVTIYTKHYRKLTGFIIDKKKKVKWKSKDKNKKKEEDKSELNA